MTVRRRTALGMLAVVVAGAGVWWLVGRAWVDPPAGAGAEDQPRLDDTAPRPIAGGPTLEAAPGRARGSPVAPRARTSPDGVPRRKSGTLPSGSDPSRGPFRGVVVDENGSSVAGATVRALADSDDARKALGTPSPRTTSDADGRFAFTLAEVVEALRVMAQSADGHLVSEWERLASFDEATLVLRPSHPLRVRVLDARKSPVPGVTVRARTEWGQDGLAGLDPREDAEAEAVTDADGRALLPTPGRKSCAVFARRPPGPYASALVPAPPIEGSDVELTVPDAGTVVGSVTDVDGKPVVGAQVTSQLDYFREFEEFTESVTTTDGAGAFRLEGVPCPAAGARSPELNVLVSAGGFVDRRVDGTVPSPGETVRVDVELEKGRRVSGSVVTADGKAYVRARVYAMDRAADEEGHGFNETVGSVIGTTDSEGRFSSDRVAPSARSLRARGYSGGKHEGVADLPDGIEAATVRIVVTRSEREPTPTKKPEAPTGPAFVVHVLDADGRPVEKARVDAKSLDAAPGPFWLSLDDGETDSAGGTTLHGLPRARVLLIVTRDGHPAFATEADAGSASGEVIVRIPSGRIEGTVVGVDGRPLGVRFRVQLISHLANETSWTGGYPSGSVPVTAGADGRFVVSELGEGEYQFTRGDTPHRLFDEDQVYRAGASGVRLVAATAAEADALMPVGEWTDAESGLPALPSVGVLRVHRTDVSDREHELLMSPVSEEPGRSRAHSPLVPGVYTGSLAVVGYRPVPIARLVVPDGDHAPRIRLQLTDPVGRVEGSVRDASGGRPPAGVRVQAVGRSAVVRADGTYILGVPRELGLSADVEVDGDHVRAPTQRVKFEAPGVAHADFVVEPAGAIRVRLPAGRTPQHRAIVTARPIDRASADDEPRTLEIDAPWIAANGSERTLGGLLAGRYRVSVAWDGDAWPASEVDVKVGETTVLDVRPP